MSLKTPHTSSRAVGQLQTSGPTPVHCPLNIREGIRFLPKEPLFPTISGGSPFQISELRVFLERRQTDHLEREEPEGYYGQ